MADKREYSIAVKKDCKFYVGYCLEIPQARGQGDTRAEAIEDTKRAIKLCGAHTKSHHLRILNYLLDFPTNDFTKKEIIQALGMSNQTFYKNFDDLEASGMVKSNRTEGEARLYKIDRTNPMIKTIIECERKLSMQIAKHHVTVG